MIEQTGSALRGAVGRGRRRPQTRRSRHLDSRDRLTSSPRVSGSILANVGNTSGVTHEPEPTAVTRTFLFWGFEGSTALWEHDPGAAGRTVAAWEGLARQCVAEANGELFKLTGDGGCAAFESAASAVRAAVEMQRRIGPAELPARMALTSGEAQRRDDDWYGAGSNCDCRTISSTRSWVAPAVYGPRVERSAEDFRRSGIRSKRSSCSTRLQSRTPQGWRCGGRSMEMEASTTSRNRVERT